MARRSRALLLILVVVGLIGALPFLASSYLASGSFRERVRQGLSQKLDRPVELETLRVSLFPVPRIVLGGVTLGPPSVGPNSQIEVGRADLTVRLRPLLRRNVEVVRAEIDSIVVRVQAPPDPRTTGGRPGLAAVVDGVVPEGDRSDGQRADANQSTGSAGSPRPSTADGGNVAPRAAGFDIAIEDFRLSHGAIHVVTSDGAPSLDLSGLSAQLQARASKNGDVLLQGKAGASAVRVHLPGGTLGEGLAVSVEPIIQYRAASDHLEITKFDLRLGELPIAVTGRVESVRTDRLADITFAGGPASVDGILGFLPSGIFPQFEGVQSTGTVALGGRIHGSLAETPPSYDIELTLEDGRLSHPKLPEPLTRLELSVRADPTTIHIVSLQAESAHSRLSVEGTISDYRSAPRADLRVSGDADLALVAALQQAPDMPTLVGRISADLTARGPLQDATRPLEVEGSVRLQDVSARGGSLERPVERIEGTVHLTGTEVRTDGVGLQVGRSDFRITGNVADYTALMPEGAASSSADLRVVSRLLDLDEFAPPSGATAGAAVAVVNRADPAADARTRAPAQPAAGGNAFFAMLGQLDGPVRLNAEVMRVRGVETRSVDAAGRLERGLVKVERARLAVFGGQASTSGTVDLRDLTQPKLDLDFQLQGAEASELFQQANTVDKLAGLGGYLSGQLNLGAKLVGRTDQQFQLDLRSLTSTGEINLASGKVSGHPLQSSLGDFLKLPQLADVPIRDWLQKFSIENGRLQYQGLKISALGAELRADGWQSIDGQVGMSATILLPPELSEGLRQYVPRELQSIVFEPQNGRVVVPLTVSGPAQAPRVTLDSAKLEQQARARLEARLSEEKGKLEKKVTDEAKGHVEDAKSRLRDRLTGGAARDSVRTDSTGTDLQKEVEGVLKGLLKKKK